mmetsp:Transcript_24678/g.58585  ORF Transcript_24678/g.58585 Transcript_24678/m.58585 type:complete len:365 (-) Transcript_24678:351-1445(-)
MSTLQAVQDDPRVAVRQLRAAFQQVPCLLHAGGLSACHTLSHGPRCPVAVQEVRPLLGPVEDFVQLEDSTTVLSGQVSCHARDAALRRAQQHSIHPLSGRHTVWVQGGIHLLRGLRLLSHQLQGRQLLLRACFGSSLLLCRLSCNLRIHWLCGLRCLLGGGLLGLLRLLLASLPDLHDPLGDLLPDAIARLAQGHLCHAPHVAVIVRERPLLRQVLVIKVCAEDLNGVIRGIHEPELLGASFGVGHHRAQLVAETGLHLQAQQVAAAGDVDGLPLLVVPHADLQHACEVLCRLGCEGCRQQLPLTGLQHPVGGREVEGRLAAGKLVLVLVVGPLHRNRLVVLELQHDSLPVADDDAPKVDGLGG